MPLPENNRDELENLLHLIKIHCTNDQIQTVLRKYKEINRDVRVSGDTDTLISNLREAIGWIPEARQDAYAILCDAEESGHHVIHLFRPVSEEIKGRCGDGNGIATVLFGEGWDEEKGFPLFHLNPVGEHWADFRITQTGHGGSNWLAKIYAGNLYWETVERKEQGDDLFIHRRKTLSRETYLMKWHHQGILEIRLPSADSKDQRETAYQVVKANLLPAIDLDTDFQSLDLRGACKKILQQSLSPEGSALYSLPTIDGEDDDFAKWKVTTRTSMENLSDHEARRKFMEHFLNPSVSCNQLGVVWHLTEELHGEKRDLLTSVGKHGRNTILIRAKATAKAIQHVVDQLRRLA